MLRKSPLSGIRRAETVQHADAGDHSPDNALCSYGTENDRREGVAGDNLHSCSMHVHPGTWEAVFALNEKPGCTDDLGDRLQDSRSF